MLLCCDVILTAQVQTNVRTVLEGLGLEPNPTADTDASALAEVHKICSTYWKIPCVTLRIHSQAKMWVKQEVMINY